MELSQLEVFLAVARERRFSRAAEKLFRTQSAVSQTIRKLEDEIGEALFDRSSREGVLTDAGKVLLEYAEKLMNLRREATESLAELRELQKGKLVIAANEFTVLYLLPVLAEFRRLHPMIRIMVERALGSHIPDDVLRYSAEFGVLSYEPQETSLHSVVVYLDELVFVVPPTHPLARRRRSASANWARSHLLRISFRRPIAKKLFSFSRRTKLLCTWSWNCPRCRPSNNSSRWDTEWRWFPRSAWRRSWREANWWRFRCGSCG